jgi:two-component system nitrogen regulation response regulator GlnG
MSKLLVVDDEPTIRHSFRKVLSDNTTVVVTAGTLAEARSVYADEKPDVILLDLQLPDGSGLDFFEEIRRHDPKRPVIFITAQGTTDTAIEAMKHGAFDYLMKPIDLDRLQLLLPQAFEAARMMQVPTELPSDVSPDRILGRSPVIQEMCKTIGRIAAQDVNVLIVGESGTGKELVARALYHHSNRSDKPFLAINCAAVPENLVESELFGHEQGAFTGAHRQRIGKFEQCDGGTLLLDEIGDMPLPVQAKMLRLLQEQQFERVGGNKSIATHVRVIAATNKNLESLIHEGKFRNDLYYRLKVVSIRVPALRERREDIPELAHHFLFQYAREVNRAIRGFTPDAIDQLQGYDWPGNVRELQGVIKSAVLATGGPNISSRAMSLDALPTTSVQVSELDWNEKIEALLSSGNGNAYTEILGQVERELITRALARTHGHQGQASILLGINRTTLRTKLREFGMTLDKVVTDKTDEE